MAARAVILALIIGATGAYAQRVATHSAKVSGVPALADLPRGFDDGWVSVDFPVQQNIAEVLDADVTLHRVYKHRDGRQVTLFVAYFKEQQVNSQIHSPRHCVPGGGWSVASVEQEELHLPTGRLTASRMRIHRNDVEQEMLYWFRTRGGTLTGEYALKWDLIVNSLARRPTDAAFVRLSARLDDGAAMRDLAARLSRPLDAVLTEVGLR